jgi:hypothetical protein
MRDQACLGKCYEIPVPIVKGATTCPAYSMNVFAVVHQDPRERVPTKIVPWESEADPRMRSASRVIPSRSRRSGGIMEDKGNAKKALQMKDRQGNATMHSIK